MDKLHEQLFTIQQISRKLDIPRSTLRFWEKEFNGLFVPSRTNGGQRRYSAKHITIIRKIKKFKTKGLRLEDIKMNLIHNHNNEKAEPKVESIEDLADRVAEVVKNEVYQFFMNAKDRN